jgi:plasmid stabilization system protein ParE
MKVRFREMALADLDEISRYLTHRSPTGARNVLQAIHAAIANVAEHPRSARRTSDPSVRVKIVGRYRYQYSTVSKPTASRSCTSATARGVPGCPGSD